MISKRLQEIANLVTRDRVVFDVGSDHGLLPCFLLEEGICHKAYAGDNKQGPLNRAIETITTKHLQGKVIPVLSDGIEKIKDDVDIIIIAGMGFYTVKHILENKDLHKYEKIIVQVNKDVNLLRQFISDNHYTIIDEKVVQDGFYYEIVVFNSEYHDGYSDFEIKYGPILLKKKEPIFLEYLRYKQAKLKNILMKTNKQDIVKTVKEIEDILV